MRHIAKISQLLAALCAITWLPQSFAQPAGKGYERLDTELCRVLVTSGEIMPMMKLVELVNSLNHGQIVDTSLIKAKGRYVYEMEVANSDGLLHVLFVDAKSGEVYKSFVTDEPAPSVLEPITEKSLH